MDGESATDLELTEETLAGAQLQIDSLRENLESVIRGKTEAVDLLIVALLANGSVLMEDVPGLGKTMLAKSLAISLEAQYRRIQFTPDMLPADIVGGSIYNPKDGTFDFRAGPIFCQILLADEINRASPRTQSALLEAMAELQVTIEGETHLLPSPFLVLATQNPVEFHGTYPLPEAQLDRFMMMLSLGYPSANTEVEILRAQARSHPVDSLRPVLTAGEVVALQEQVRAVKVDDVVAEYMVAIVNGTRESEALKLGVSTRGTLMLYRACQASAFMRGRHFVTPDDVQEMAVPTLSHRLTLNTKAKYDGTDKRIVLERILRTVSVPV